MAVYSHTGQCVRDLDRARSFYVEVLGFEEVMDLDVSGSQSAKLLRLPDPVGLRAVYLKRDGFVLELLAFTEPAPLAALFLGISSGFAFSMIGATLTTRLAQHGITKSAVTAFALTFLAYNFKFLWAPMVDNVRLPLIGRLFPSKSRGDAIATVIVPRARGSQ